MQKIPTKKLPSPPGRGAGGEGSPPTVIPASPPSFPRKRESTSLPFHSIPEKIPPTKKLPSPWGRGAGGGGGPPTVIPAKAGIHILAFPFHPGENPPNQKLPSPPGRGAGGEGGPPTVIPASPPSFPRKRESTSLPFHTIPEKIPPTKKTPLSPRERGPGVRAALPPSFPPPHRHSRESGNPHPCLSIPSRRKSPQPKNSPLPQGEGQGVRAPRHPHESRNPESPNANISRTSPKTAG